jgi:uncharacterized protein (TIGR00299 family) protein
MTGTLYLDCVGGLAGDMLLGALLDAGAERARLDELPERLGIEPVEIAVTRAARQGIEAVHVDVRPAAPPVTRRTWASIRDIVERADLPGGPRARALGVLTRLAEAEAKVHGTSIEDVRFHELGGVDTLVDVCGATVLLDELGIGRIICSPLPLTRGIARGEHGLLPLPAPAAVELLRGADVRGVEGETETVTPTGAALAVGLAEGFGPIPPFMLEGIGYGAGTADTPERPNVLRVLVGSSEPGGSSEVVLLETNLDDLNPELVPDAIERCFAAGALDVWTVPVQMKKGRPGLVFSALSRPADERAVATAILEETSALGVRTQRLRRYELDREERVVSVGGGKVRLKLGRLDGRVVNIAPEHDDCAEIARHSGRPVKSVWAEAMARGADL